MKRLKSTLSLLAILTLFCACGSQKEIAYLQNSEQLKQMDQQPFLYDARILPKDLLSITISSSEPALAAPFNQGGSSLTTVASVGATSDTPTYLVDNKGNIDFPILGTLHLGGLTKGAVEDTLRNRLKGYLKETPIVNVRMTNYKFTVLGEVGSPNTFTVANEKVNVFEALAMAGDMTIFGQRGNVKLLREDEQGRKQILLLDLKDPSIITSPYYYLQQNDILYVEPNKTKVQNVKTSSVTAWFSAVSVLTSLVSLSVVLFK